MSQPCGRASLRRAAISSRCRPARRARGTMLSAKSVARPSRTAEAAARQCLHETGVGQRAEVDGDLGAAAAEKAFHLAELGVGDRAAQSHPHRLRERRIGGREDGAASGRFQHRRRTAVAPPLGYHVKASVVGQRGVRPIAPGTGCGDTHGAQFPH